VSAGGGRQLDETDRRILNLIQTDFPLVSRPFSEIGERVGLSEQDVIRRVREMKRTGAIRRIGGSFDSRKLGFFSTLCAAKVDPERLERFNRVINAHPGVTHNYMRNHDYNVWFTFIGENEAAAEMALTAMARETGVVDIVSLPARRTFKIRVNFAL
jgi:DNA-binding Lrp family transcriptional regulator